MSNHVSATIWERKAEAKCDGCGRMYAPMEDFIEEQWVEGELKAVYGMRQVGATHSIMMGDTLLERFLQWLRPEYYRPKHYCSRECSDWGWISVGIPPPPRD